MKKWKCIFQRKSVENCEGKECVWKTLILPILAIALSVIAMILSIIVWVGGCDVGEQGPMGVSSP
jgi:hypothetical protein